jgi:hypothetical protein
MVMFGTSFSDIQDQFQLPAYKTAFLGGIKTMTCDFCDFSKLVLGKIQL